MHFQCTCSREGLDEPIFSLFIDKCLRQTVICAKWYLKTMFSLELLFIVTMLFIHASAGKKAKISHFYSVFQRLSVNGSPHLKLASLCLVHVCLVATSLHLSACT